MLLLEQGFEPMTSGFVSQKTDRKFETKTCAPLFAHYQERLLIAGEHLLQGLQTFITL